MSLHLPASNASPGQNLLAAVDARTNLAGTNKMELLLFKVGSPEIYGINVFKVKEVIRKVEITQAPESPAYVMGMASLRGVLVPVVDLIAACGNPPPATEPIMIVTEFSGALQAFLVEAVETIIRVDWSEIHQPPSMLSHKSKLTGVTRLADGRLASILDVEQILHTISGKDTAAELAKAVVVEAAMPPDTKLFFVDDSSFARNQLQQILNTIGVKSDYAVNGQDAWDRLTTMASLAAISGKPLAKTLPIIITDIEMPEMDGFKLTRLIKQDKRFDGIKVLLHSSMSEASNRDKGLAMGADGFLSKYNPAEVAKSIQSVLADIARPA
ncbi:MAG: chemotaxis signal transduction protein CheV [Rhodocyclaceae bacterium]|nr:chemotaxis signal transduction protein CheV [Rhodocyclaceae bacterium]